MAWVAVGLAVAGSVAGKMKNDQAKAVEDKQVKLASDTQRYSPWTGMSAGPIQHAGSAGADIFAGGVGGAMMGQSLNSGMKGMNGSDAGTIIPQTGEMTPNPNADSAIGRQGLGGFLNKRSY